MDKAWIKHLLRFVCVAYLTKDDTLFCQAASICNADSIMDSDSRSWVETDRNIRLGTATRIIGAFCSLEPVTVQLWESPPSSAEFEYKLVWSTEVIPGNTGVVEIIDLPNPITITSGYRVGFTSTSGPLSVMKRFDDTKIQIISSEEKWPFEVNGVYQFVDVKYPGEFLIDFCGNDVDCPNVELPELPPANAVECTGLQTDFKGALRLEQNHPLATGVAKAISTHFCGTQPVRIQLWESPDGAEGIYTLMWQKSVTPTTTEGLESVIILQESEYIDIKSTYRLGLQTVNVEDDIPIPTKFNNEYGGNLYTLSAESSPIALCHNVTSDGFGYPNEFILKFCYDERCTQTESDTTFTIHKPCTERTTLGPDDENTVTIIPGTDELTNDDEQGQPTPDRLSTNTDAIDTTSAYTNASYTGNAGETSAAAPLLSRATVVTSLLAVMTSLMQ